MEYYNFCQQYKDYFATAETTGPNQIPFTTFFLWDQINFCLYQHKRKLEGNSLISITWDEFKAFFRKFLEDSKAFVNSYWAKIKRDS